MAGSNNIAIDLGTSHVLIQRQGGDIALNEPAVVAVSRDTNQILALGTDAQKLVGRTPGNVEVVRPLRQGTAANLEVVGAMLASFTRQVIGRRALLNRPKCVLSLPTGMGETERRAMTAVLFEAGVRRTQLLERPLAAALGVGIRFDSPYGSMVVDIGAGATDIAVLSMNEVAVSSTVPVGGDYYDDAIIRYLRKKHNLLVGERTAEAIKLEIGSAVAPEESTADVSMSVTGRNLVSGLPKTQQITAGEIYEALKEPTAALIEAIQGVIEHTPPQLASDIFEDGVVLTGGGAALTGLAEAVYQVLRIPCGVPDRPETMVVAGCARALEDPDLLRALERRGR